MFENWIGQKEEPQAEIDDALPAEDWCNMKSFVTYLCLLPYEIFCRFADSVNLDLCAGL